MFPNIPNRFYDANTNITGSSQATDSSWFSSISSITVDFNGSQRNDLMCFIEGEDSGHNSEQIKVGEQNCGVSSLQNMRAVIF